MKNRVTAKQAYKKEFINGVYQTIAACTYISNEEAKRIRDYAEKFDITRWYKEDKETLTKCLSLGSYKYKYKVTDAEIDARNKGEKWAEIIMKRLGI